MARGKTKRLRNGNPLHKVEAPARVLLPEIQKFFENQEGQREFAEWKAEREAEQQKRA